MGCLLVFSVAYAKSIKPIENVRPTTPQITTVPEPTPSSKSNGVGSQVRETQTHSIRAAKTISEDSLRFYLQSKGSPLNLYSHQIIQSDYWSTIIGICTIEELNCTINPYGSFNFWGLMAHGQIIRFSSMDEGINAIEQFLSKAENNGRTTIESFRGWYCASACTNWESVVIKTKQIVENL